MYLYRGKKVIFPSHLPALPPGVICLPDTGPLPSPNHACGLHCICLLQIPHPSSMDVTFLRLSLFHRYTCICLFAFLISPQPLAVLSLVCCVASSLSPSPSLHPFLFLPLQLKIDYNLFPFCFTCSTCPIVHLICLSPNSQFGPPLFSI